MHFNLAIFLPNSTVTGMPYLPAKDEVVSFNCLSSRGLWKVLKFQGFRPATIWRGGAFHFLAVLSKKKILSKLWLLFIVIFENVSPKGLSWLKMKYFEISVLTANSRYLQIAALKKGKCHDGRCIHLYWLASRRRWFPKPNWLTWSEPELIIRL